MFCQDSWTDIKVETPLCFGNHVAASTKYVACNIGSAGLYCGKLLLISATLYRSSIVHNQAIETILCQYRDNCSELLCLHID